MSSFLPSELINEALNAMDGTIRSLQSLRNIIRQTYGDESWEVRTVQGCIDSVKRRHLKLQADYTTFRDTLFNHPDQYYEGLGKPTRAYAEPCDDPNCSVCESFKDHRDPSMKAKLIGVMLDHEYSIPEAADRDTRERMEVDRQVFAGRMGWPNMTVEQLREQVRAMGLEDKVKG